MTLDTSLATLRLGDHVCLFYRDRAEQLAIAAEYIKQGLSRRERCLYVCDDCSENEVRAGLEAAGVAVTDAEREGAFLLVTKKEAYLRNPQFDAEGMLNLLNEAVETALDLGYTGLRATGEMTWTLAGVAGTERAIEYEGLMNEFYPSVRAVGLCQYHVGKLPAHMLEGALRTHPTAFVGHRLRTNHFFEPPDVFFDRLSPRERVEWKLQQLTR